MELTPDWVCKLLSSNIRDNVFRKKNILAEWQVPYHWIVDPLGFEIRIFELEGNSYKVAMDVDANFVGLLPPFKGQEISLKELFGIEN